MSELRRIAGVRLSVGPDIPGPLLEFYLPVFVPVSLENQDHTESKIDLNRWLRGWRRLGSALVRVLVSLWLRRWLSEGSDRMSDMDTVRGWQEWWNREMDQRMESHEDLEHWSEVGVSTLQLQIGANIAAVNSHLADFEFAEAIDDLADIANLAGMVADKIRTAAAVVSATR